jgi:uncharacterized protein YjbJ (UPF0337 family)
LSCLGSSRAKRRKKTWGKLSDDDMKIIEDEWAQVIGRIQNKGGTNEAR